MGLGSSKPPSVFLGLNLNRLDPEKKYTETSSRFVKPLFYPSWQGKKQADGKNFISFPCFFLDYSINFALDLILNYCIIVHWHPCPWIPLDTM